MFRRKSCSMTFFLSDQASVSLSPYFGDETSALEQPLRALWKRTHDSMASRRATKTGGRNGALRNLFVIWACPCIGRIKASARVRSWLPLRRKQTVAKHRDPSEFAGGLFPARRNAQHRDPPGVGSSGLRSGSGAARIRPGLSKIRRKSCFRSPKSVLRIRNAATWS